MNAAFLLVATAWAPVGQPPAAPPAAAPVVTPAPAVAAPIAATPNGGACCGGNGNGGCGSACGCDSCCNDCCGKPSFFERCKAHFHKSSCCDACDTCSTSCGCGSYSAGCGCGGGGHHHHSWGGGCGSCASSCNTCNTCAPSCDCGCECKPSFFERCKAHFHKSSCCDACDTCSTCGGGCGCGGNGYNGGTIAPGTVVPGTMPPAGEPIKAPKDGEPGKKLPAGGTTQGAPIVPEISPATTRIDTGANSPFELDRRYETRVNRAADYGWVTGQLFFVHADGGLWVLRYAPVGREDPNGGSVVLARDRQMDSYREGDLVTVRGEIINDKSSIFLGGPLYRARSIQLVERGQKAADSDSK